MYTFYRWPENNFTQHFQCPWVNVHNLPHKVTCGIFHLCLMVVPNIFNLFLNLQIFGFSDLGYPSCIVTPYDHHHLHTGGHAMPFSFLSDPTLKS